jgi:uncharacterized membrane-anchored protein
MSITEQRCAFCGDDVAGPAGCSLALYAGAGVRVGRVWLPLCANDVRYMERLGQEERRHRPALRTTWRIAGVHDGSVWKLW